MRIISFLRLKRIRRIHVSNSIQVQFQSDFAKGKTLFINV